ncbi:thioredoxin fold domain-containing protein [Helicobacter sp. 23-1044]
MKRIYEILIVFCVLFLSACENKIDENIISKGSDFSAEAREKSQNLDKESYKDLAHLFLDTNEIDFSRGVLIIFGKNQCKYCDMLKDDIKKNPAVQGKIGENFNAYYINISYDKTHKIVGNSSLTQSSREFEKFSLDEPLVLSRSNFSAQPTNLAQDTRIAEDLKVDSANQAKIAESAPTSSLRASEASVASVRSTDPHLQIQDSANAESNKNQSCEAPKTRPLRGAKNRKQTSSSASADFLLEAKAGHSPKSEKRQLLARRGSGVGGAALLREKSSESNAENGENIVESQNLKRDSSPTAQNDKKNVDCHDSATQNLAMTGKNAESAPTSSLRASEASVASVRSTDPHLQIQDSANAESNKSNTDSANHAKNAESNKNLANSAISIETQELAQLFGVNLTPQVVFIKEGKVKYLFAGYILNFEKVVDEVIANSAESSDFSAINERLDKLLKGIK